jgi:hypothetical protein
MVLPSEPEFEQVLALIAGPAAAPYRNFVGGANELRLGQR